MVAVVEGINQIVTSDLLFVRTRFYFHQQLVIYYMESMVGFTVIRVGVAYYGLRPVVEFVTFNFSMQGI